jgi:hypothetical protein
MQLARSAMSGSTILVHVVKEIRDHRWPSPRTDGFKYATWLCGNTCMRATAAWEGELDEVTCFNCRRKLEGRRVKSDEELEREAVENSFALLTAWRNDDRDSIADIMIDLSPRETQKVALALLSQSGALMRILEKHGIDVEDMLKTASLRIVQDEENT